MQRIKKRDLLKRFYSVCAPSIVLGVLMFIILFGEFLRDVSLDGVILQARDSFVILFDPPFQGLVVACLSAYIVLFAMLTWRDFQPNNVGLGFVGGSGKNNILWCSNIALFLVLIIVWVRYVGDYANAATATDTVVLLVGIMLNQSLVWVLGGRTAQIVRRTRKRAFAIFVALGLGALLISSMSSSFNSVEHGQFFYHGETRWMGIWQNPNRFGLLTSVMCISCVFRVWHEGKRNAALASFYFVASVVFFTCVVKSYSRGAWIAGAAGALFIILRSVDLNTKARMVRAALTSQKLRNFAVTGVACFVFGYFLVLVGDVGTRCEIPIAQRICAAFGNRDFSSENRVAAYRDGINMILDRPLTGYGWNSIFAVHNALYLQSGLLDGGPLLLNDFLMFALRFGLPAFAAFTIFLWQYLAAANSQNKEIRVQTDAVLCQAAAVTFAVGFVFNDGLFRLATGGAFWLFLTLGLDLSAMNKTSVNTITRSTESD
jgi:O-antigen ligase